MVDENAMMMELEGSVNFGKSLGVVQCQSKVMQDKATQGKARAGQRALL